jgi:hypothetical protein
VGDILGIPVVVDDRMPPGFVAIVAAGLSVTGAQIAAQAAGACGVPYRFGRVECSCHSAQSPPSLDDLPDSTMLAVAAGPGKVLEEWRHADFGVWIGWPHAVDAVHAEEMTAGQLRAILAERDHG